MRNGEGREGSDRRGRDDRIGIGAAIPKSSRRGRNRHPNALPNKKRRRRAPNLGLPSVPRGVPRRSARARARKRRERGRISYLETLGAARATRGEKFLEAGPLAALGAGGDEGTHGQRETPRTKCSDDGCRRFGRVGVESGSSASRRKETGRDRGETRRAAGAPEESNREGAWTRSAAPPRRRRAATLAAPNATEKRHTGTAAQINHLRVGAPSRASRAPGSD